MFDWIGNDLYVGKSAGALFSNRVSVGNIGRSKSLEEQLNELEDLKESEYKHLLTFRHKFSDDNEYTYHKVGSKVDLKDLKSLKDLRYSLDFFTYYIDDIGLDVNEGWRKSFKGGSDNLKMYGTILFLQKFYPVPSKFQRLPNIEVLKIDTNFIEAVKPHFSSSGKYSKKQLDQLTSDLYSFFRAKYSNRKEGHKTADSIFLHIERCEKMLSKNLGVNYDFLIKNHYGCSLLNIHNDGFTFSDYRFKDVKTKDHFLEFYLELVKNAIARLNRRINEINEIFTSKNIEELTAITYPCQLTQRYAELKFSFKGLEIPYKIENEIKKKHNARGRRIVYDLFSGYYKTLAKAVKPYIVTFNDMKDISDFEAYKKRVRFERETNDSNTFKVVKQGETYIIKKQDIVYYKSSDDFKKGKVLKLVGILKNAKKTWKGNTHTFEGVNLLYHNGIEFIRGYDTIKVFARTEKKAIEKAASEYLKKYGVLGLLSYFEVEPDKILNAYKEIEGYKKDGISVPKKAVKNKLRLELENALPSPKRGSNYSTSASIKTVKDIQKRLLSNEGIKTTVRTVKDSSKKFIVYWVISPSPKMEFKMIDDKSFTFDFEIIVNRGNKDKSIKVSSPKGTSFFNYNQVNEVVFQFVKTYNELLVKQSKGTQTAIQKADEKVLMFRKLFKEKSIKLNIKRDRTSDDLTPSILLGTNKTEYVQLFNKIESYLKDCNNRFKRCDNSSVCSFKKSENSEFNGYKNVFRFNWKMSDDVFQCLKNWNVTGESVKEQLNDSYGTYIQTKYTTQKGKVLEVFKIELTKEIGREKYKELMFKTGFWKLGRKFDTIYTRVDNPNFERFKTMYNFKNVDTVPIEFKENKLTMSKITIENVTKKANEYFNKAGFSAKVTDLSNNNDMSWYIIEPYRAGLKFSGLQINFNEGIYEVNEVMAGKNKDSIYIFGKYKKLGSALVSFMKGNNSTNRKIIEIIGDESSLNKKPNSNNYLPVKSSKVDTQTKAVATKKVVPFDIFGAKTKGGGTVFAVPTSIIKKREDLFQNRKSSYAKRSVENILKAIEVGKFNWALFDSILLFWDIFGIIGKKDLFYVISGHSRLQAFIEVGGTVEIDGNNFEKIPAKVLTSKDLDSVREIALNSNTLGTKESYTERAAYFRTMRELGKTKVEIRKKAKETEGSNASRIIAYSYLNPNGKAIDLLARLEPSIDSNTRNAAAWLGRLRSKYEQLTDAHENEIFDWLIENIGKKVSSYSEFMDFMERIVENKKFNPNRPLNIKNKKVKTDYDKEFQKLVNAQMGEIKKLYTLIQNNTKRYQQAGLSFDEIHAKLANLYSSLTVQQIKLVKLLATKTNVNEANKQAQSLFGISGVPFRVQKNIIGGYSKILF